MRPLTKAMLSLTVGVCAFHLVFGVWLIASLYQPSIRSPLCAIPSLSTTCGSVSR